MAAKGDEFETIASGPDPPNFFPVASAENDIVSRDSTTSKVIHSFRSDQERAGINLDPTFDNALFLATAVPFSDGDRSVLYSRFDDI